MKTFNTLFLFSCFVFAMLAGISKAEAQIVITEIMYDSPETGVDSLEYIELYNVGASSVNILNYKITEAFTKPDTFPSFSIPAGGFFITCKDTAYYRKVMGTKADHQWRKNSEGYTNKALNNEDGETIKILSNTNALVDSVKYSTKGSWPKGSGVGKPNGGGASLVLCDVNSDNNEAANWSECTTSTGRTHYGKMIFANPKALGGCVEQGVFDNRNAAGIKIYPNPATTSIQLETATNGKFDIVIMDIVGRVVSRATFSGNRNAVDVSNLFDGAYILQIIEDGTLKATEKFSIRK